MKNLKDLFKTDVTSLRGASSMLSLAQRESKLTEVKDKAKSKIEGVKKLWK